MGTPNEDQGRRISWFSWAKKKTTENLDQQETNVPDADKDKKNSWFTWTSKKTSIANETKKVKTINDAEESEKEKKGGKPKTNLTEKKSLVQTSNSLQIRHKPSRQRSMSDGCIFKGKILNHSLKHDNFYTIISVIHVNSRMNFTWWCDSCHAKPIEGFFYQCLVCWDFIMCENCKSKKDYPIPCNKTHPFTKVIKGKANKTSGMI